MSRRSSQRPSTAVRCNRSHWRALDAVVEFVAAERTALVPVADWIGGQLRVGGERLRAVVLRAPLRTIAEPKGRAVVPPGPRIVRRAEKDFVAHVGMLEADADELHQIRRRDPDRKPAPIERRVAEIADADAGDP